MNAKNKNYETVYINQYINLLKKLKKKKLLNSDGSQYSPEEYCMYRKLVKTIDNDRITYDGRIILNLRGLTNYEIAMLMEQEDIISYNIVRRDYLGNFRIIIYK